MFNFLGPLKKNSSSLSTPPSSADVKASDEEEKREQSNTSLVNGDFLTRKITEIKNEVAGANGTVPVEGKKEESEETPTPCKTELEELKEQATNVATETLMSTRRMAEFCENAKDAGIKIIVALDDQKEQLDRVQDSLTSMREDLIQADSNIQAMEKCCGIFNNPFKKSTFKDNVNLWRDAGDGVVIESGGAASRPFAPTTGLSWPLNRSSNSNSSHHHSNSGNNPGGYMPGGYIPKITEDKMEEEMEKNMDLVSSMLGNLRNMAIDMNTEIESQNKQMTIINDMTEQNNARIDDAIQRTHDLKR